MAKVETIAREGARLVGLALVGEYCGIVHRRQVAMQIQLWREAARQVTIIREGVGNAPHYVRLALVRERFRAKRMSLVPQHTVLKLGKLLLLFRLVVP